MASARGGVFGRSATVSVVVLLTIGLWLAIGLQVRDTLTFLGRSERAMGEIADARPHPIVRFRTRAGASVAFQQNGSVSLPQGDPVPVAYDPEVPEATARVATFWALWSEPVMLLPLAVLFGGVLVAMLIAGTRRATA